MGEHAASKLLGSYQTPPFRYGDVAVCEVRGGVVITGLTDARIPWPVGKVPGGRARTLVVFADLAAALRVESASAICAWWGVTPQTVSKYRKALGVGPMTPGTARLKSQSAKESPRPCGRPRPRPPTPSAAARLPSRGGASRDLNTSLRPCDEAGWASHNRPRRGGK